MGQGWKVTLCQAVVNLGTLPLKDGSSDAFALLPAQVLFSLHL